MRRRPGHPLAVLLFALLVGCTGAPTGLIGPDHASAGQSLSFRSPVVIEDSDQGHEPSLTIAPDGTIYVCAPHAAKGTSLWRSTDNGSTFQSLGTPVYPGMLPIRSTTGDAGGYDCDVSLDAAGRVYLVDNWIGSASLSWSDDRGNTWSGTPLTQRSGSMDRPWVLGGAKGEVFITSWDIQGELVDGSKNLLTGAEGPAVGGIWVSRSTDGGVTFSQQSIAVKNDHLMGLDGNLVSDGSNLILYYTKTDGANRVAYTASISKDHGATWTEHVIAEQPYDPNTCVTYPLAVFPSIAADHDGHVYATWASQNPTTKRFDLFFAASSDHGEHWNAPVVATDRSGTRLFPWIATSGNGHIGLAWYEANETIYPQHVDNLAQRGTCGWDGDHPVDWYVHYADVRDAASSSPTIQDALPQGSPVHHGPLLGAPFAEMLHVAFAPDGHAAVSYVSDTKAGPTRPMFALQS